MEETRITVTVKRFCIENDVGETLARQMIADGRLRAIRVGKKKLLVDLRSWQELIAKQNSEGVPEYTATSKAIETRKSNRAAAKAKGNPEVDLGDLGLL